LTTILGGEKSEGRLLKKMHERIIKNFMDIIVMAQPRNGPLSDYDVISYIHNEFHLLVSSETVYSLLCSLERKAWLKEPGTKERGLTSLQRKAKKQ